MELTPVIILDKDALRMISGSYQQIRLMKYLARLCSQILFKFEQTDQIFRTNANKIELVLIILGICVTGPPN